MLVLEQGVRGVWDGLRGLRVMWVSYVVVYEDELWCSLWVEQ